MKNQIKEIIYLNYKFTIIDKNGAKYIYLSFKDDEGTFTSAVILNFDIHCSFEKVEKFIEANKIDLTNNFVKYAYEEGECFE